MRSAAVLLALSLLAVGCGGDETPDPPPQTEPTHAPTAGSDTTGGDGSDQAEGEPDPGPVSVAVTVVASGLETPWDLAFLDGRAYVSLRDRGIVGALDLDGTLEQVRRFDIDATGEGGLLGLASAPGEDRLYAYVTTADDNRVVRFRPGDAAAPEVVLSGIPKGANHNGGRIAFGPDGLLYVATGDAGIPELSQERGSLAGKILRLRPDGTVPGDNPFPGSAVLSLGHRNVQGLAWDADGRLYATEFGPGQDDEINRIEAGGNYGWPAVTGDSGTERFVDPIAVQQPPDASWSGAAILRDGAIPQWEGNLLAAALRGTRLWRFVLRDGAVAESEELYTGEFGRLRHVEQAPDGSLWLLTSNRDGRGRPGPADDRILRLGPS